MFKMYTAIYAILLLVLYSCTFHRSASDYRADNEFYESINRQALERDAYITLSNDSVYIGSNYNISSDSSRWIDASSGKHSAYHNSMIRKVMFEHPVRGLINGYLFGTAAALVLFVPIYYLTHEEVGDQAGNLAPLIILSGVGFVGSVTGAIVGYSMADKHVYLLNQEE